MPMTRLFGRTAALPAILALSMGLTSAAGAAEERIGERIFLVRDKPDTTTQFQMIVNAGCSDESGAQCRGLAHYLEHLVLTGRNPEHKDIAVRFFADGYANGWTNQKATVFIHSIPPRPDGPRAELEKLFAFYAARLKDFTISDADALRERNVVRQEHDWRVGSDAFARFARKLRRELLPNHPAGQWTIGTKEEIEAFTLEDAHAFHRTWYAPNNAYFVVKGDIEAATLRDIAASALAGIEMRPLPERASQKNPDIVIERKELRETDKLVKRAAVYFEKLMAIEGLEDPANHAARAVAASFLTSRLPGSPYDVLVEQGKLAAGQISLRFERIAPQSLILSVSALPAPGVAAADLLAAVERYVDALAKDDLSAGTVERLQTRMAETNALTDRDPNKVYGRLITWLASRTPYEDLATWPKRIADVSPDQVTSYLHALSGSGRIVTGILESQPEESR
jgi:zinc protease